MKAVSAGFQKAQRQIYQGKDFEKPSGGPDEAKTKDKRTDLANRAVFIFNHASNAITWSVSIIGLEVNWLSWICIAATGCTSL